MLCNIPTTSDNTVLEIFFLIIYKLDIVVVFNLEVVYMFDYCIRL